MLLHIIESEYVSSPKSKNKTSSSSVQRKLSELQDKAFKPSTLNDNSMLIYYIILCVN